MNREERRQHREHLAELEAIADEVATELGDWSEEPAPEPGRVVGLEERRTARGVSGATREGMIRSGAD